MVNQSLGTFFDEPITRQLFHLLVRTNHFLYAYQRHAVLGELPPSQQIVLGFYSDTLLNMIGDWNSTSRGMSLPQFEQALDDVGVGSHELNGWNAVLSRRFGNLSWLELIKKYRNLPGTHRIFDLDSQRSIAEAAGGDMRQVTPELSAVLDELYEEVLRIRQLVKRKLQERDQEFFELVYSTALINEPEFI